MSKKLNRSPSQLTTKKKTLTEIMNQKIGQINKMKIQDIYKLEIVKNNNFQLYNESLGLISKQDKSKFINHNSTKY